MSIGGNGRARSEIYNGAKLERMSRTSKLDFNNKRTILPVQRPIGIARPHHAIH